MGKTLGYVGVALVGTCCCTAVVGLRKRSHNTSHTQWPKSVLLNLSRLHNRLSRSM